MRAHLTPFLAAVALLGAACTSSIAEPTAPAATPPIFPPPAKKNDGQGATAFATHWLDLVDYGYQTLDAGPLRGLGSPTCQACTQFITQLDQDKAAGTLYRGGRLHFHSAIPTEVRAGKATITTLFDQDELTISDRAGKVLETVPANRTIFVFELAWTGGDWRAAAIKLGVENASPPK